MILRASAQASVFGRVERFCFGLFTLTVSVVATVEAHQQESVGPPDMEVERPGGRRECPVTKSK